MKFEAPSGLKFSCTRCGDCCRGWQVLLGPGESDFLRTLRWDGLAEDLAQEQRRGDPFEKSGNQRVTLKRREDGRCVFLGTEQQCRLHEHFGEEAKPLVCRMFPFGFFPVDDRMAVDVSFACRSVAAMSGAPVEERMPEWSRLLTEPAPGGTKHKFSKKYSISGELLWDLEHQVVAFMSDTSLTVVQRLRAIQELMRLGMTSDPRTENAKTLRNAMTKGIPALVRESKPAVGMDRTQRAIFYQLVFLSLNPTPAEVARLAGKARLKAVRTRVGAAEGYKFPQARPWLDNRELHVSFAQISKVARGYVASTAADRLFSRYFNAKIIGQRFMREGPGELAFVEAVPRLLLSYPMVIWTAKALAAERDVAEVSEPDMVGALRLFDRSFGEIPLTELPAKQRKAWSFVLLETELALCACSEVVPAEE